MTNDMKQLIAQGQAVHGDKFDASDLDERFARYYFSKERIKVSIDGEKEVQFGTVGKTTGWKPAFLLMRSSRAMGSSVILGRNYCILGVQQKGYKKYSRPY